MSANRDHNQRVTFVYSNLYQVYKSGKEAALAAPSVPSGGLTSAVIKAGDRRTVEAFQPVSLMIPKPLRSPAPLSSVPAAAPAVAESRAADPIQSLKENLKSLNDLHSRLRFMLKELEELVKE